jgi:HEAT repeat protein
LGKIGVPSGKRISALLDVFKDSDENIRANASQSVARLGLPALAPLLETLKSASAPIRELAVDALLELGPQAQPAVDSLLALLGSEPESNVRFRAAGALGAIGDSSPKVLEALEKSAANDQDPTVRAHSTGALRTLTLGGSSPSNSSSKNRPHEANLAGFRL